MTDGCTTIVAFNHWTLAVEAACNQARYNNTHRHNGHCQLPVFTMLKLARYADGKTGPYLCSEGAGLTYTVRADKVTRNVFVELR